MRLVETRSAIVTEIQALVLGVPIVWENTAYSPSINQAFIRFGFVPSTQRQAEGRGNQEVNGAIRFDIHIPADTGTAQAMSLQDSLEAMFTTKKWLDFGVVSVKTMNFQELPGGVEGSFFVQPVQIDYRAEFDKNATGQIPLTTTSPVSTTDPYSTTDIYL